MALLLAALAQSASPLNDSPGEQPGLALRLLAGRLSARCGWSAVLPAAIAGLATRWFFARAAAAARRSSINWRCIPRRMGNLPPSCGAICCGWFRGCCLSASGVASPRSASGTGRARTLGWGRWQRVWRVKPPMAGAPAADGAGGRLLGGCPSIYPPCIGWGRPTPTLASEAVALSSGGGDITQTLAAQALWQLLLLAMVLTACWHWLAGRYRRGLR